MAKQGDVASRLPDNPPDNQIPTPRDGKLVDDLASLAGEPSGKPA